jgi:hypothetical protein
MEPDVLLLFSLKYSIGYSSEADEFISHPVPLSSISILSQVVTTCYFLTKGYIFYHNSWPKMQIVKVPRCVIFFNVLLISHF